MYLSIKSSLYKLLTFGSTVHTLFLQIYYGNLQNLKQQNLTPQNTSAISYLFIFKINSQNNCCELMITLLQWQDSLWGLYMYTVASKCQWCVRKFGDQNLGAFDWILNFKSIRTFMKAHTIIIIMITIIIINFDY